MRRECRAELLQHLLNHSLWMSTFPLDAAHHSTTRLGAHKVTAVLARRGWHDLYLEVGGLDWQFPPTALWRDKLSQLGLAGDKDLAEVDIRNRIEARISQGEFLANMLQCAHLHSDTVQADFVERLSAIATTMRELLTKNGLIRRINYDPKNYWPGIKGKTYAFVDGGVANVDLPSAAPIGIRVGSYVVRPGDDSQEREKFNIELSLVDDLYSRSGVLYDDDFLDLAKLRDAARMISELAVGRKLAAGGPQEAPLHAVILHGPLVNPVAPYGLDDFPSFGLEASRTFLGDEAWSGDERDRQFVSIYLELLRRVKAAEVPVIGAVERSIGKDPVFVRRILDHLHNIGVLKESNIRGMMAEIISYGLNDSSLLDVVLSDGEYVVPIAVGRQGPTNKWPENWKSTIGSYPKVLTTYIKPSGLVMPFRIEAFESAKELDALLALILHTSRLLPSYGFPVGLDIVDRFAKVPAWLSRGVKGQHQVVLLKQALASGDANAIAFAKRVVAAKGRDWLFRPSI